MKVVNFSLSTVLVYIALLVTPALAKADQLNIMVTPLHTVFGTGPISSCLALETHQRGDIRGTTLYFPNFKLNWVGKDHLYIESVRITTESPELYNGKDVQELPIDEINSMFGTPAGGFVGPITVESEKRAGSPCGLAIGSFSLAKGSQTPNFTATVRIELYAVAVSADGSYETPLVVSTTGSADYMAHLF